MPRLPTIAIVAVLAGSCSSGKSSPAPAARTSGAAEPWTRAAPALLKEIDSVVAESQETGAIHRLDVEGHLVLINPVAWQTWEIDDRKTFTATLAMYCDQHGAAHGRYVDIIDDRSGKKLAHYGPAGAELY